MPAGSISCSVSPKASATDLLFGRLTLHFEALDRFLLGQVAEFEPEIQEQVAYCLQTSGKRIRPALVFFSGWEDTETVSQDSVRLAAVIEMVHLATLVHDDIMDAADVRRNRHTASRRYGQEAAVLLGDALFAHAVHLATCFPDSLVCREVSQSCRRVCAGEIMQTLNRGNRDITLPTYRRIIDLKTAELFRVSCDLGARIHHPQGDLADATGAFGRHLGIAYQMYDDLADFFGDEISLGKTLGTDLASGKFTLPLLELLERLPEQESRTLRQRLTTSAATELTARTQQMRNLGVLSDAVQQIQGEIRLACAQLKPFSHLPPAQLLGELASVLVKMVSSLQTAAHSS